MQPFIGLNLSLSILLLCNQREQRCSHSILKASQYFTDFYKITFIHLLAQVIITIFSIPRHESLSLVSSEYCSIRSLKLDGWYLTHHQLSPHLDLYKGTKKCFVAFIIVFHTDHNNCITGSMHLFW